MHVKTQTYKAAKWHLGRMIAAGIIAEIVLIIAILPLGLHIGDAFLRFAAPPGSFLVCFVAARRAVQRVESHFVLHGLVVGVSAATFYLLVSRFRPEPLAYVIAHVLKLAGGAAGGYVSQRKRPVVRA